MARKTTPTHVLLNQIELSSAASSVTFSSIPQGYGDLVLVCKLSGTSATGGLTMKLRLNGDSAGNYYDLVMGASSGGAFSNAVSGGTGLRLSYSGDNGTKPLLVISHIMDYSASDKHKTVLTRHSGTADSVRTDAFAGRWANTNAVTSVTVIPDANSIASGSALSLFGIET